MSLLQFILDEIQPASGTASSGGVVDVEPDLGKGGFRGPRDVLEKFPRRGT